MSCPCENIKREMPKCEGGTPPVLEINSVEAPVLFHTVTIPASIGDETTIPPTPGAYRNARVFYEANNVSYLYDSDGIPQILSDGTTKVTSVNGQIGDVTLSAADLGAQEKLTAGTSITISNRNVISAPPVDTVLNKTSPNPISNSAVATAIDTITTELDRTVVYDLEMDADAESVSFTEDKIDVVTGITSKEVDTIPAASATSAGIINAADFRSITYSQERLDALENGSVAIANLSASPSQTDLTNAWMNATGYDELINRASIFDITNSKVWTYYTNILLWEETPAGAVTVNPFTNSTAGTILGSNVDGNISANVDGTGSVAGWSTLVGLVNTKGEGDMKKSTYDTNNNGIVDNSEKVNNHTVNDNVPANVFSGQATGTVSGTELTISDPIIIDNIELKGDTEQTTYSGVQLVTKQGMATPTNDPSFWNFISGDITFTPLTDGWGRFVQTNSDSTIYGNLFVNYSGVDLDLDTDYTIIFEFKNITATSGTYDIAQRTASADPFGTLSAISGCTYSGTNISVNIDGSNTFAVFKGHTKTTATTMSIRTFTRPNFPMGKGFDVRVSCIKGDHSSDWQNYCGDNYQPYVGGTASPNPDYPQEVQTVTGRQVVTITDGGSQSQEYEINLGKNLFDKDNISILNGYFEYSGDTIHSQEYNRVFYIPCEPNTRYSITQGTSTLSGHVFQIATTSVTPAVGVAVSGFFDAGSDNVSNYLTASDAKYMVVRIRANDNVSTFWDGVQIEKGSTITTYAPYFTPIELCKIGDYQDYIYKSGDDWYVHKDISKVLLDGTQYVTQYETATANKRRFTCSVYGAADVSADAIANVSDKFVGVTRGDTWNNKNGVYQLSGGVGFYWEAIAGYTRDQVVTWLASNNVTVYYALATPTDTKITDENLIGQLNDLERAGLSDTTEITVDGSLPAILNVTYFNKNLNGICGVIRKLAANS
jgi:hypothetical protein